MVLMFVYVRVLMLGVCAYGRVSMCVCGWQYLLCARVVMLGVCAYGRVSMCVCGWQYLLCARVVSFATFVTLFIGHIIYNFC